MGNITSALPSVRRASRPPPVQEDYHAPLANISQDYYKANESVLYSAPFFLRTGASAFFWSRQSAAAYWAVDDDLQCRLQEIKQSSLITFHGPHAMAYNLNHSGPQVHVQNEARVLIYCNIGRGKYLCGRGDSLSFYVDPNDVRASHEVNSFCEFIVHRTSHRSLTGDGPLGFGEAVYFECAWSRGKHLTVLADGRLGMSRKPKAFVLATPTLQQLLHVRDQAALVPAPLLEPQSRDDSSAGIGSLMDPFAFSNDEERLAAQRRVEKDQEVFALLPQLPLEIALKIVFFHQDFLKTARLVCKEWHAMAQTRIRAIRVNGEFANLETAVERRHLVQFVRSCPNLTSLTLRNVTELVDSELSDMFEGSKLVRVALGGCCRLSDVTTKAICKSPFLRHVNLASTSITDQSLCFLAESAKHIRFLNLYACREITPAGVLACQRLEHLESINLRGTRVHQRDTIEFTRRRPSISLLTGPAVAESIYG